MIHRILIVEDEEDNNVTISFVEVSNTSQKNLLCPFSDNAFVI